MACLPVSRKSPSAVLGGVSICEYIAEEILLQICEYSCDSGVDVLSFSLTSTHFADATRLFLRSFIPKTVEFPEVDLRDGFFRALPQFRFSDHPRYRSPDLASDSLVYYCRGCLTPVARHEDLEHDQYHGSLGPAFLARVTINTEISSAHADYPVQYTTGHYRVGDVRCVGCARVLGRKYLWAEDVANYYKIGKVLMEATLVETPLCCSAALGGGGGVAVGSSSGACSRCTWWQRRDVAKAILKSTGELGNRRDTEWLYKAFLTGKECGEAVSGGGPSLRRRLATLLWGGEERWRSEMESLSLRLVLLDTVEEDEWRLTLRYLDNLKLMDKTLMLQSLVINYFRIGKSNIKHLFYRLDNKEDRTAVLSALAEVSSVSTTQREQALNILNDLKKDIYVPSDSLANWLVCGRPHHLTRLL